MRGGWGYTVRMWDPLYFVPQIHVIYDLCKIFFFKYTLKMIFESTEKEVGD